MRSRRPSPGTLIALVALFVALGGPAWAAKKLSGSKIRSNSVTTKQIKNNSLRGRDIRAETLSRRDLSEGTVRFLQRTPDRSVRASSLATGSITGDKLTPASVGTIQVADNTLTAADVAPGSLTRGVLGADVVGFDELGDNAVGKANVRAAAVGKSELARSAVGAEEVGADVAAVTFGSIPAGSCASIDSAPADPATDLTKAFVMVAQPASWPGDTVTLGARALNATTLRFTACNLDAAAVTPGPQVIPYATLIP